MPGTTSVSAVNSVHFEICMGVAPIPSLIAFELARITSHPRYREVLEKLGKFNEALNAFPSRLEGLSKQEIELATEQFFIATKDFCDLIKEVHGVDLIPEAKSLMLQLLKLCQLLNLMDLALIWKR